MLDVVAIVAVVLCEVTVSSTADEVVRLSAGVVLLPWLALVTVVSCTEIADV